MNSQACQSALLDGSAAEKMQQDGLTTRRRPLHRNVPLGLIATLLTTMRGSLGSGIDAYILLLPHGTNVLVGILEGCRGVANLICTVSSGIASDRFGRSVVLRPASLSLFLGTAAIAVAIFALGDHERYYALCAAAVLQSMASGLGTTPIEALFGDSTPSGAARARFYSWKGGLYTLGLASGPLCAILIFSIRGDTWTKPELVVVMLSAEGIGVILACLLCLFRDVRERDDALLHTPTPEHDAATGAAEQAGTHRPTLQGSSDTSVNTTTHDPRDEANEAADGETVQCCGLTRRHVAPVIAISNLFLGLGSGMTYKFQPLFCWMGLGLSPIQTQAIVASFQYASRRVGPGLPPSRFSPRAHCVLTPQLFARFPLMTRPAHTRSQAARHRWQLCHRASQPTPWRDGSDRALQHHRQLCYGRRHMLCRSAARHRIDAPARHVHERHIWTDWRRAQ